MASIIKKIQQRLITKLTVLHKSLASLNTSIRLMWALFF